jgi:argininosuccinate lyase
MSQLWSKGMPLDELILKFTVGQDYLLDERLIPYDVEASKAHADMLASCGYLTSDEAWQLGRQLDRLAAENAQGKWHISLEEEDCHTALENRLGELGKKIHLGRSRNDQVLVALRLYMRSVVSDSRAKTQGLAQALEVVAREQGGIPLPGYTHLQRAMPSSVALWAGGFAAELRSDTLSAALELVEFNPLGSAAGYGTPGLNLDRDFTSKKLGFKNTQEPVTAVQLSRGKAEAALAFALTLILQDVGRMASDLCLFATQEFGFVTLPQEMTTGSSIMPQKRNPDVFELVRGVSAQAPTQLQAILAITSKMPSGYHRDLQLIKAPLFQLIDSAFAVIEVMTHAIAGVRFNADATAAACTDDLYAAERAFKLVTEQGMAFRDAYKQVAEELSRS